LLQSVIDYTYKQCDDDLFINVVNNEVIEVISIKQKVGITYYVNVKQSYYPVLINRKLYMVILDSDELYVASLSDIDTIKRCAVTKCTSRKYLQTFVSAFPIGISHIACIGYYKYTTNLTCQIYNIAKNSWISLPNVPVNMLLSFTAWLFSEEIIYVFANNNILFSINLMNTEEGWKASSLVIPNSDPNTDFAAVQISYYESLLIADGLKTSLEDCYGVKMYVVDHKTRLAKLRVDTWDHNSKLLNPLRLSKEKYLYGKRRDTYFKIDKENLRKGPWISIIPNDINFY